MLRTSAFPNTLNATVRNTGQPAFLAFLSASQSNVTGNGGVYTVIFDTEVFDQASNYNNATGTFTAPVDGKYQFNITINANPGSATGLNIRLVTSNRPYRGITLSANAIKSAGGDCQTTCSFLADMDAADTATVTVVMTGLAGDTAGVFGSANPQNTVFSGFLAC